MTTSENVVLNLPDEVQSAEQAGLRYGIPKGQGIRRKRSGSGFTFIGKDDKPLKDEAILTRIKALVLPPAWTNVWISPSANNHIQAVGWDARGRKQYRYHPEYRKVRDLVKFDRMRAFGKVIGRIRRAVNRDLARKGMPKQKVFAAIVKLLETTYIRVGNEEYAEENGSFGLTTLRNQHVQILGEMLKFKFRGKSGQHHEITVKDPRLASILRKCKELPGSDLFQYVDEAGERQAIDSGEVNEYLKQISGGDFTAKDFRTWGGTCLAANCLIQASAAEQPDPNTKQVLVDMVKEVASKLGNKPATCRKYYIHPVVMDSYSTGNLKVLAEKFSHTHSERLYEQIVLSLVTPLKRARAKAA